MAGFLDPKECVIDLVLTDTGKSLLMKGDLQFVYWIPFDDEVDYDPPATPRVDQTLADRQIELLETPLIREATMGYKGLNLRAEDTTNLHRPMYSAAPGVGQNSPLPQLKVDTTTGVVSVRQTPLKKYYGPDLIAQMSSSIVGFKRETFDEFRVLAGYDHGASGSLPADTKTEGFLITMHTSGVLKKDDNQQDVGGFAEVIHNFDSTGSIVYSNDLKLINYTP